MTDMDWGRMIYLLLLVGALLTWFFVHNRQSLGRTLQHAMAWLLIFVGVIAMVGLWDDIRTTLRPQLGSVTSTGGIEVPRAPDGHYYLTLKLNDTPVTFMVDTGASQIVLTQADAKRAGIDLGSLAYIGRAMTANGEVRTAPIRLDTVALGPIKDTNLPAQVNEGEMGQSLLGMTYLQRFQKIEITRDGLLLTR
ncbi:retropepsin-like aspartic protease family protein [Phaeobacter marinintestinus]|uniref:retropepsin-like aspartic protease family protein n=1 Tax=Falsiphaeobacter marinintestinus TaxID=1492905 RepID=UPI0011B4D45E|nr:TIGR02281 family clan AA aspartic protease [Phaeobacter marinintestinus]